MNELEISGDGLSLTTLQIDYSPMIK